MHTYYWVEFIPFSFQLIRTRTELDADYLKHVNYHNRNNSLKHAVFAIPVSWYNDNSEHSLPLCLLPENRVPSELIMKGLVMAKKKELSIMARHEFEEYVSSRKDLAAYYHLLEKEAQNYLRDHTIDSFVLKKTAERKSVTVGALVQRIMNKVRLNDQVTLNSRLLTEDLTGEIDRMSFEELCNLEIIDEIKRRLSDFSSLESPEFDNPANTDSGGVLTELITFSEEEITPQPQSVRKKKDKALMIKNGGYLSDKVMQIGEFMEPSGSTTLPSDDTDSTHPRLRKVKSRKADS